MMTSPCPTTACLFSGDLDVVSGNAGGIFSTYSVPEPLRGLMLGAGIVLLRGLGAGVVSGDYPAELLQQTLRQHFEASA